MFAALVQKCLMSLMALGLPIDGPAKQITAEVLTADGVPVPNAVFRIFVSEDVNDPRPNVFLGSSRLITRFDVATNSKGEAKIKVPFLSPPIGASNRYARIYFPGISRTPKIQPFGKNFGIDAALLGDSIANNEKRNIIVDRYHDVGSKTDPNHIVYSLKYTAEELRKMMEAPEESTSIPLSIF